MTTAEGPLPGLLRVEADAIPTHWVEVEAVDSVYAEHYWLPIIGPSCLWLLRRLDQLLADRRDGDPGVLVDTDALARSIGVSAALTRNGQLPRTIARLQQFHLAVHDDPGVVLVRRRVPRLGPAAVRRLPEPLQSRHRQLYPALRAVA